MLYEAYIRMHDRNHRRGTEAQRCASYLRFCGSRSLISCPRRSRAPVCYTGDAYGQFFKAPMISENVVERGAATPAIRSYGESSTYQGRPRPKKGEGSLCELWLKSCFNMGCSDDQGSDDQGSDDPKESDDSDESDDSEESWDDKEDDIKKPKAKKPRLRGCQDKLIKATRARRPRLVPHGDNGSGGARKLLNGRKIISNTYHFKIIS